MRLTHGYHSLQLRFPDGRLAVVNVASGESGGEPLTIYPYTLAWRHGPGRFVPADPDLIESEEPAIIDAILAEARRLGLRVGVFDREVEREKYMRRLDSALYRKLRREKDKPDPEILRRWLAAQNQK